MPIGSHFSTTNHIEPKLYDHVFVKGIASHFIIPETLDSSFRYSQEYKQELTGNKNCKKYTYIDKDEVDLLSELLNLIDRICPDGYKNYEPYKNISPEISNYKNSFSTIIGVINTSQYLHDSTKKEFSSIIDELKESLEPALIKNPKETKDVIDGTQTIAGEVAKEKPNKFALKCIGDGLISAAKAVTDVAPLVLGITKKIATFISELPAS